MFGTTQLVGFAAGRELVTTTVFNTPGFNADDAGNNNYSFRQPITITGSAAEKIRVTFAAASGSALTLDFASVGIQTGGAEATVSTPIELLFSGVSGFAISAGQSITSDWADLMLGTGDTVVVVVMDLASANANLRRNTAPGAPQVGRYYKAAVNSYNEAAPAPTWSPGTSFSGVAQIDVQG